MSSIDRILDKFTEKRDQIIRNQLDNSKVNNVWLAGFKSLGENSARIILGSTEDVTVDQARQAVSNITNNEMVAYTASFTPIQVEQREGNQSNIKYSSIFALKAKAHFRKATDEVMAKCKLIGNTQYLDVELQNIWDRKEINGEVYLVRVNENNPEDILKTALMAKTDTAYKVNSDQFITSRAARPGDYVEFFALSKNEDGSYNPFMDVAQVVRNNGDNLEIQIKEGTYNTKAMVSAHAVTTVIQAAAGTSRQQVMDYLYKAFGDKWKEIVTNTGAFNVDEKGEV